MKRFNSASYIYLFSVCMLLSACSSLTTHQRPPATANVEDLTIAYSKHKQSPYLKVSAHFISDQPKQLVYRVISDLALTTQWFDGLQSIETIALESNNNYVLRSIINSPWPFKDREVITCVTTHFSPTILSVEIIACADKVAIDKQFVRVKQAQSRWKIEQLNTEQVKVSYTAWINPEGSVPALIFNHKLATSSHISLSKLQRLIAKAKAEDYAY